MSSLRAKMSLARYLTKKVSPAIGLVLWTTTGFCGDKLWPLGDTSPVMQERCRVEKDNVSQQEKERKKIEFYNLLFSCPSGYLVSQGSKEKSKNLYEMLKGRKIERMNFVDVTYREIYEMVSYRAFDEEGNLDITDR